MGIYPAADQSRRYDTAYPQGTYVSCPWRGVLHTTETTVLPSYGGGAMAPHFTVVPDRATQTVRVYQHFDTGRSARALVDGPVDIRTNRARAIQIELTGTCDRTYQQRYPEAVYWPDAPQWALDGLAALMRWIESAHGVRRGSTSRPWLPYPRSYGTGTAARMTPAEWSGFDGWCGHQHIPDGNAHGDPGDLPIARLLGIPPRVSPPASAPKPTPTPEDDTMTPDQIDTLAQRIGREVASALLASPIGGTSPDAPASVGWGIYRVQSVLMRVEKILVEVRDALKTRP